MTQEEKKLLYKDLSARQPHRPFICFAGKFTMPFLDIIASTKSNELMSINGLNPEDVKPYLCSFSSMTEEEENEYRAINCYEGLFPRNEDALDYVLEHHLDFRNLIEKGLAIEAPENMYKED